MIKRLAWTVMLALAAWVGAGSFAEPASYEILKSSKLYSDLLPLFRGFHESLSEFSVLTTKPIDGGRSVFLVHAAVPPDKVSAPSSKQDFRQNSFGLFVIDDASGRLYMTIDIFATKRFGDYEVAVEEVDERHVDIRRQGATYGDQADRVRYFLDLKQKKVLTATTHFGMNIYSMIEFQGSLYFLGTGDGETTIITRRRSPGRADSPAGYEITDTLYGKKIQLVRTAETEGSKLILSSDRMRYVLSDAGWIAYTDFETKLFRYQPGSGKPLGVPWLDFYVPLYRVKQNIVPLPDVSDASRRLLVWNRAISAHSSGRDQPPGIYDMGADGHTFYAFPTPTYTVFKQYRPNRVADGYTEENTTLQVEIGPFQLEGTRLWFGTTFYDGEGTTGIGGIGYFDAQTKTYRVTYLKETADWSVSAIHVDNRFIWLGVVGHPEGSSYAGGLVRYDRITGTARRYAVPTIVNAIHRFRNHLYLGTRDGIYILADDRISHVGFELDVGRRYHLRVTPP